METYCTKIAYSTVLLGLKIEWPRFHGNHWFHWRKKAIFLVSVPYIPFIEKISQIHDMPWPADFGPYRELVLRFVVIVQRNIWTCIKTILPVLELIFPLKLRVNTVNRLLFTSVLFSRYSRGPSILENKTPQMCSKTCVVRYVHTMSRK